MFPATFCTISAVFATLVGISFAAPEQAARLLYGQEVDTLRQFPHHVYIIPFGSSHRCGGTILTNQWILTSASCVKNVARLDLNFGKKSENNTRADFFSVSVNKDHVYLYPTNYDDIALIKIPLQLVFSETIAPVSISRAPAHGLNQRFSVMPGFNEVIFINTPPTPISTWAQERVPEYDYYEEEGHIAEEEHRHFEGEQFDPHHHPQPHPEVDGLKYGMFSIVDHHVCQRVLGVSRFDEYTQLCVKGWGTNPNAPCCSDFGSGLIIGWPAKSELVGVFSMFSPACSSNLPAIFTYVPKYLPWIESMIRG